MAATSTSSSIRQQVSNLITSERANSHSATAPVKSLPLKDRYSRLMQAATALHRASTDSTYKLSDTQKKDCAAAAIMIAEKRGIKPSNDGKYTQKDVQEFLKPEEMMTNLASFYIYDAKKENGTEETDTRKAIEQDIKSVYENNEQAAQPAIAIAQAAPAMPKLSKEAVLSMGDDEYKEYAMNMDPADKAEMDKERSKNENDGLGDDINPNKDVVDYKGLRDDPDWGHKKDDDDFKIEQGDIIEYLMKDVILSSVAWAGNRVAGFAGTISYELLSAGVKEIHPYGRTAKEWVTKKWDKFVAQPFNNWLNSEDEPASNKPSSEQTGREQTFDHITGMYTDIIANCTGKMKAQEDIINDPESTSSKLHKLKLRVTQHLAVLGNNGITFDDGTTLPYTEACGINGNPENVKNILKNSQEIADTSKIEAMCKTLGYQKGSLEEKELREWYQKYTKRQEECIKTGNLNLPAPEGTKKFINAYNKASEDSRKELSFEPHATILTAQSAIFAANYAMYAYTEELRKNPTGDIATNQEKAEQFFTQQRLNAHVTFLTIEKARSEGKTELNGQPLLSREGMLTEAEKLVHASKKAIEQKKTEPVQDTKIKPFINPKPASSETVETMLNEALKPDPSAQYAAYMHNLDMAEKEQILRQDEVSNRRNKALDVKNKILNKTKGTDGKGGVDIGKKYQTQGGRN